MCNKDFKLIISKSTTRHRDTIYFLFRKKTLQPNKIVQKLTSNKNETMERPPHVCIRYYKGRISFHINLYIKAVNGFS